MAKIGAGIGQKVKEKDKEKKPGSIVDSLLNNKKNEKSGSFFNNKKETERSGLFFGKQEENEQVSQPNDAFQAAIQKLMGGVNNGFTSAGIRKPTIAMPQQTQPIMQQQPAMSSGAENYARRLMQLGNSTGATTAERMTAGIPEVKQTEKVQQIGSNYAGSVANAGKQVEDISQVKPDVANPSVQEPKKEIQTATDYTRKAMSGNAAQQAQSEQDKKLETYRKMLELEQQRTERILQETGRNVSFQNNRGRNADLEKQKALYNFFKDDIEYNAKMNRFKKWTEKDAPNWKDTEFNDYIMEGAGYGAYDENGEKELKSNDYISKRIAELDEKIGGGYSEQDIGRWANELSSFGNVANRYAEFYSRGYNDPSSNSMNVLSKGRPADYFDKTVRQDQYGRTMDISEYYDNNVYDMFHLIKVNDLKNDYDYWYQKATENPENEYYSQKVHEARRKLDHVRDEASEIWEAFYNGTGWQGWRLNNYYQRVWAEEQKEIENRIASYEQNKGDIYERTALSDEKDRRTAIKGYEDRAEKIGDDPSKRYYVISGNAPGPGTDAEMELANMMTKKQAYTYTTLKRNGEKEAAEHYYELLKPELEKIRNLKIELRGQEKANEENPLKYVINDIETVLTKPGAAAKSTLGSVMALFNDKEASNPDSDYYVGTKSAQAYRNQKAKNWGYSLTRDLERNFPKVKEWADKLGIDTDAAGVYFSNVADSIKDNMYAMKISKGVQGSEGLSPEMAFKASVYTLQAIMSMEATGDMMLSQLEQGRSPTEAAITAIAGGAIEAITEKWTVEQYLQPNLFASFKNKKEFIQFMGRSMIAEGTEEVAADLLNTGVNEMASYIWDHRSELQETYLQHFQENLKTMSFEEAAFNAAISTATDYGKQLGLSFNAGVISTVPLTMGAATSSRYNSVRTGSTIMNIDNYTNTLNIMLDLAQENELGPDVKRLASEIRDDMQNGKKPSRAQIGKLTQLMSENGTREQAKVYTNTYTDMITDELTGKGLTVDEARKQAEIISKAALNGMDSLTRAEKKTVMNNNIAARLMLDETRNVAAENKRYQEAISKAEEENNNAGAAARVATMAAAGVDVQKVALKNMAAMSEEAARQEASRIRQESGKVLASEEEIADAARNTLGTERTGSEVVVTDEDGNQALGQIETDGFKLETEDEEGNEKAPELKIKVNINGQSVERYLSDLKATSPEMAKLITMARERSAYWGGKFATAALQTVADLGDNVNERFAQEVISIKAAAMMNRAMPANITMDEAAAQRLYNTAVEERTEAEKEAVRNSKQIMQNLQKPGTVMFDGQVMTREQISKAVRDKNTLGREIEVAAAIAEQFHLDVEIVKNLPNGEYGNVSVKDGRIQLAYNEDFGKNEGIKRSVLATLSHELPHMMRAMSTEAFNNMAKVAYEALEANGENILQLSQKIADSYAESGKFLSMDVAMEEVVAHACEQMLTSDTFKNYMQEHMEKSAFQRIKAYVRGFIEKLNKVIDRVRSTTSYESRQLGEAREQIAKVWLTEQERIMTSPAVQEAIEESRNISTEELRAKDQELGAVAPSFKQSLAGRMAKGVFGQDVARAIAMHRQGIDNDTILEETNCIPGYRDGQYYRVLDNDKVKVLKTDLKKGGYYAAYEIIQAEELFEAYPDLMNINVMVTDELPEGVIGRASQDGLQLSAQRFESYQNDLKRDMIKLTMLHELEHYRQMMEGDYRGSSPEEWTMYRKDAIDETQIAGKEIEEIKKKYGLTLDDDISGLKFVRGEIDPDSVTPEVYQKLQNMDLMDQWALRANVDQMELWGSVLYRADQTIKTPVENYKKTIGEINARAASERSGAEQYNPIDYRGAMDADKFLSKSKTAQQMMAGNIRYSAKQADVDYAKAVADGNIRYSVKQTYNMSWGEQVEKYLKKQLNRHDVLTVTKKGEMGKYGIDQPITMAQSVMTKGMKLVDVNKSASAHNIEEEKVRLLSEGIKNPVAKIETSRGTILVTNLLHDDQNIIAAGRNIDQYIKGGTLDIKSFYSKKDLATLFGKYDNGHFVPDQTAKITLYKNSAKEILSKGSIQYGAGAEVLDAIDSLTEKGENGNSKISIKTAAQEVGLKALDDGDIETDSGEKIAKTLEGGTLTKYSLRSWAEEDRKKLRDAAIKAGFKAAKVDKWMKDIDSIGSIIAQDRDRLDFVADRDQKFKKPNGDVYKWTLDASTLCAKRLLYQGTFNKIQQALPNIPLRPGDLIELANMMHEMGYQTPCGICYVESRRRHLGNYTEEFLNNYTGEYKPTYAELTSTEGLAKLKINHRQAYDDYIAAMNGKGVASPKVVQLRTDYRGDVRDLNKTSVENLNEIGGLRINSFSDFETPHLMDMMQAVFDMSVAGLKSQAYTKVPNFAWAFGRTGIKINLSLMGEGTGVDADGNLIFSDTEGMKIDDAMKLRQEYSDNVGTILVGMNDEHIIAAMGDPRIDFIIPFHKSGWSQEELSKMKTLENYSDYQDDQNEKWITGTKKDGGYTTKSIEKKTGNLDPYGKNGYWNYKLSGEANARKYLEICAKEGRLPKFSQFLVDNGDGTFSLPEGTDERSTKIREGYWKTLIDFKMYNNDGKGVPQKAVKFDINMDEAKRILNEYEAPEGGNNALPSADPVVDRFVNYMKEKQIKGTAASAYGNMTLGNEISEEESEEEYFQEKKAMYADEEDIRYSKKRGVDWDVNEWMERMQPWQLRTESERQLLADYKDLRMKIRLQNQKISDYQDRLKALQAKTELTESEKKLMEGLNIRIRNAQTVKEELEQKLIDVTGDEGYAKIMMQQSKFVDDFLAGRTQDDVAEAVNRMMDSSGEMMKRIAKATEELKAIAENEGVKRIRSMMSANSLSRAAGDIVKQYRSTMNRQELMNEIAKIRLEVENGDPDQVMADIEALAGKVLESAKGEPSEYLGMLRGMTLTLSPSQVKEMKGTNRTLTDLRKELAGTGIKIKTATTEELTSGKKTALSNSWDELCDMIPALNRDAVAEDQIFELLDFIQKERAGENQSAYTGQLAEVMSDLLDKVTNVNMNKVADPALQNQLNQIHQYVQSLAQQAGETADVMGQLQQMMQGVIKAGEQASTWTDAMKRDVANTIEYFDRTAKLAQDTARNEHLRQVIANLKSEAAQKLLETNQQWREMMERDRQARMQDEENDATRRKMNTVISRVNKLLSAPKGLNNIPEHMQGLARELMETLVDNDISGGRKITTTPRKQLYEMKRKLDAWKARDGEYNAADMNLAEDSVALWKVEDDLNTIREAIAEWNGRYNGKNNLENVQMKGATLKRMQEAVSELYSFIKSEQNINILDHQISIADQAEKIKEQIAGKIKQEWTGKLGGAINAVNRGIVLGNMTPEYVFRMLDNEGLSDLWDDRKYNENRNGLEMKKAQDVLEEIAEKHNYSSYDMKEKHEVQLANGKTVKLTTGQLMSLYATWNREQTLGPEMSEHLTKGGFFAEEDTRDGIVGKLIQQKRANRVTEADMATINSILTDEQRALVDDVVRFMSEDMSKLGNEASMKAFGMKIYKEKYYFPFKMWDGIKSRKTNEAGQAAQNQAFHPSFSKSRMHGANNALIIGDFMETATDHIIGMINYATMGLSNDNYNKVMNAIPMEGDENGEETKRNIRTMIKEAYGQNVDNYLEDLKKQLEGGVAKANKDFYDKTLSLFRKNAVAGSLSVALQQPLSYIRAGIVISPKYLAQALGKEYWKGSYQEMLQHSGVAVIKDMGKFDMNAGASAREYITPDGYKSTRKKIWDFTTDKLTILPEKMDAWTWTRMWVATKLEQKALHPEMDVKSDEFLDTVAERFNDIMRRTQVYDSVMVRSANMRSDRKWKKSLTSFMAEPTLTLNMLADAVRQVKEGKPGAVKTLAATGAATVLSAILQAAVKGAAGAGRNPDDDKTALENFLYRFGNSAISELDPLTLIPGYSDMITLLKEGELADDAMGSIGKMWKAGKSIPGVVGNLITGDSSRGLWRDVEDSVAQLMQLFTNLPMKNLMRDARMMYNWVIDQQFAERENSAAVIKYQAIDSLANADNLAGVVNKFLVEGGYGGYDTKNTAYYQRIYDAKQAGDYDRAAEMEEYLTLGKGVKEKSITSKMGTMAKNDENISAVEAAEFMREEDVDPGQYIRDQLKQGNMTAEEATKQLRETYPDKSDDSIFWTVDRIEYEKPLSIFGFC